jgi:hypothetical protein
LCSPKGVKAAQCQPLQCETVACANVSVRNHSLITDKAVAGHNFDRGGIRNAVARIYRSGDRTQHVGAAWLCSNRIAITASHVSRDAGSYHLELLFASGAVAYADRIESDENIDVAVLKLRLEKVGQETPEGDTAIPETAFLPLDLDCDIRPGDGWTAFGHPKGFDPGLPIGGQVRFVRGASGSVGLGRCCVGADADLPVAPECIFSHTRTGRTSRRLRGKR